ncbi:concanavalin A-like lectin/glucanase [Anaeromyces robustus]|uniref:Endo-1,4-beta-xylanase n=1 Tax=Anaeromyces robustus TaxID=1754192 RepID=A0A1Y1WJG1_9FUNG|nr:concanavalin A-like lectin/glucanase [Anaeromyces robustus]|eukprot:ORX73468.1 concanavalin A-like lectin/glucanase [Anaeromyces robustus]
MNNRAIFYSDGSFSCDFNGAKDFLCHTGLSLDSNKKDAQVGPIYADFKFVKKYFSKIDYSYVGAYGWTKNPLVEFYIIDSWIGSDLKDWISSRRVGNIDIHGSTYTVYENVRNGTSINGPAVFKQYFSVRTSSRDCGSIDITAHFQQWEKFGLPIGNLHEVKIFSEISSSNRDAIIKDTKNK